MSENEVTQIRIDKSIVGIIGLEQAMNAMALVFAHRSDDEIGNEILKRVSEKNYIPSRAKELYAKAFVREFRKFLGQSAQETTFEGLRVVVLGPGCAQCSRLEMDVRDVLSEMKLPGELLHTTDIREIGKYGVMGVPALVINDRVVCVGSVPHKNKIKEWLTEATSSARKE